MNILSRLIDGGPRCFVSHVNDCGRFSVEKGGYV